MRSPFFDHLQIEQKTISFKLSDLYEKSTLKRGFTKIDLKEFKKQRDLRTTKLSILTTAKPNGYLSLNYLLKALNINKKISRSEQIREIKRAFNKLKNIKYVYKYPANPNAEQLAEHYKFHYKTVDRS